jgi:hypothetical protein
MPKSEKIVQSLKKDTSESLPCVAGLYPELNRAEQTEAEYYLNRFLEVMSDIFEEK